MATVAIVLSNYNHAKYLPDSLARICEQTRPADQIIVVEDGSTDNSLEIVQGFARRYGNLEVIHNERNRGLQESIATTLERVTCDYLAWAASDDRLMPDFLKRNMEVLERHPEAALVFSETSVLLGDSEEIDRFAVNPSVSHIFDLSSLPEYLSPQAMVEHMKRVYLPISTNSTVVRTDLLRDMGGYPATLKWHSDWFAYYALGLMHGACVIPETLALVRANPGSYSQSMRDDTAQSGVLNAMLDIMREPRFKVVRRGFRSCPTNLSPFGTLMLRVLLKRPRDWDLFAPYLLWKLKEYKRGHSLTWPQVLWRLQVRAITAVLEVFRERFGT